MRNIRTMTKPPTEVESDSVRVSRFSELFSQLKGRLSKIAGTNDHVTFRELLETAAAKSAAVREVKSEINRYERFAEAIGLDGADHGSALFTPTRESIAQLENLIHKLDPLQVGKVFAKPITVFAEDQGLHSVLVHMYDNGFSQVVVETRKGLALLSSEGVARWLGCRSKEQSSLFEDVLVTDVLKFEPPETFTLARPNLAVSEAQRAFDERLSKHQPELRALVITRDGSPKGKPIGLITPWDLTYMFSKKGRGWKVLYAGDEFLLEDSKGVRYLHHLLQSPGKSVHVLELVRGVEGQSVPISSVEQNNVGLVMRDVEESFLQGQHSPTSFVSKPKKRTDEDADDLDDLHEPLGDISYIDKQARRQYARERKSLESELLQAQHINNLARTEEIQRQIAFIDCELRRNNRKRNVPGHVEQARINLTKQIKNAIAKIENDSPRFHLHLKESIKTGYSCIYQPDPNNPPRWKF